MKPTSFTNRQRDKAFLDDKNIYSTDMIKLKIDTKLILPSLAFSSSGTEKEKINRFEIPSVSLPSISWL